MQELTLSGCNFTGTLPPAWALEGGRFEWISYIDLHDNALVSPWHQSMFTWVLQPRCCSPDDCAVMN